MKKLWAALLLAGILVTPVQAETVTYLHTDLLGSVVLETDQNRNVVARYEYEPYGLPRQAIADQPGYTGHVHDAGSGLVYMQQRYYDPEVGRFLAVDPVGVDTGTGGNFNRYWYANNNPYKFTDPDGRIVETVFDVASLAIGVASFVSNVSAGNFGAAAVDAAGIVVDAGAAATPFVPGGAGVGIKALREAGEATARIADDTVVARGGAATPNGGNSIEGIASGTGVHPGGVEGFSAEAQNGASLCDLCANIVQNQVGVTTAGEIRAVGGDVVSTSGRSATHATVTGLSPEAANKLLTPTQPNPVPKSERNF